MLISYVLVMFFMVFLNSIPIFIIKWHLFEMRQTVILMNHASLKGLGTN